MATLRIRVPEIGEQLERLAESTGRTRSFFAFDALRRYLDHEEWQAQAMRTAEKKQTVERLIMPAMRPSANGWPAGVRMRKETHRNVNKMARRRHQ